MSEIKKETSLAIVGAGPGGYAAAFLAADLGMKVTLIDPRENPGGVCLHVGCIPSKALLHVANVLNEAKDAKNFGVSFNKPKINRLRIAEWKTDVVKKLTGGLGDLSQKRKIEYIRGTATFADRKTLDVEETVGDQYQLRFENAIVATGSKATEMGGMEFDGKRILSSTDALELNDIPRSMLIVGGGYIGLEMGTVYSALGTKVTVAEMTSGLLPGVDRDLVAVLKKQIQERFDEVLLNTKVSDMRVQKNGVMVTFEGEEVKKNKRLFNKVLVAVGRKPVSSGLGLENTKIKVDDKGFIEVDLQRRTTEKNIYAIGDVAGEPMLAHKASHEGRVAVEAIAGRATAFEPRAIPAVVFTDPEIAWCGLTATEAKQNKQKVEIVKFPWAASGRLATLDRESGLTKFVIDPETEQILGVGIVGPGAGELISEGALAIEMAAVVSDVRLTIHPHPTLSETVMETADLFFGESTHYYRPKRK